MHDQHHGGRPALLGNAPHDVSRAGESEPETAGLDGADRAEQSGGSQRSNRITGKSAIAIDGYRVQGYARAAYALER
jgi:hypothetical protein